MDQFNKFSDVRILVAGDLMLDKYWWGTVDRISPEAPVPVVRLNRTSTVVGGAANVAANVSALGAQVSIIGVSGNDAAGNELRDLLQDLGIATDTVISVSDRPTSVKTRIVAHNQQVVRVDDELSLALARTVEKEILNGLPKLVANADLIVISDYAKGFLTDNVISELISTARGTGKLILVDPKGTDYSKYKDASILTPNLGEAAEATGLTLDGQESIRNAAHQIIDQLSLDALIITQGESGMTLFEHHAETFHVSSLERHVYDVTGAGDTVIATAAVCLAAGSDLRDSVTIANLAAGIVVSEVGTTVITKEKLISELSQLPSFHNRTATSI